MDFKDLIKISKIKKLKFAPIDIDNTKIGGGIYRMFNAANEIVYVGKSQNLHRRLLQHLGKDTNSAYFIDEVERIQWLPNPSPIFQNLLEAIFIAFHQPKYNDEVKDERKQQNER